MRRWLAHGAIGWTGCPGLGATTEAIGEQIAAAGHPLRLVTYAPAAALHADSHRAIETALQRKVAAQAGGQLRIAVVGPIYGGSLPITRYVVSALESLGHRRPLARS